MWNCPIEPCNATNKQQKHSRSSALAAIKCPDVIHTSPLLQDVNLVDHLVWIHSTMLPLGATPRQYTALVEQYARIYSLKRKHVGSLHLPAATGFACYWLLKPSCVWWSCYQESVA